MRRTKEQPGFLIPYSMLRGLEKLGLEAAGRFVLAMGHYSREGIEPDFDGDDLSEMLWCTAAPWLDQNKEQYEETRLKNSYAGWCNALSNSAREHLKIPFDEWVTAHEGYEKYCAQITGSRTPAPFTDWLREQKERASEDVEVKLPWKGEEDCTM